MEFSQKQKGESAETDELTGQQARAIYDAIRLMKARTIASYMEYMAQRSCDRVEGLEITEPQTNMLFAVRDRGPMTVKELANILRVSAPSASSMVDRLVEMGALSREPDPKDRRRVIIRITPLAEAEIGSIEAHILRSVEELLAKVGPEYAEWWCKVHEKVSEVILEEFEVDSPVTQGTHAK